MLFSKIISLAFAGMALAMPLTKDLVKYDNSIQVRTPNCDALVAHLNKADCQYMRQIGMAYQGVNAQAANGKIWIGTGGANTFAFTNNAADPVVNMILIIWDRPAGDDQSSFMNVRKPQISYSLAHGASVTISVANGISGGWATLNNHATKLSVNGQIYNTWGEFTTGAGATVDTSREVNMGGNIQSTKVASSGCVTNMNLCSYQCKNGANTCGASGSYMLTTCDAATNNGAQRGTDANGNPTGGCSGWNNGGHLTVSLGSY